MRLKLQLKSLKTNKSPGFDSIISGMIKCANDKMLAQTAKFLKKIWTLTYMLKSGATDLSYQYLKCQ